MGLFNLHKAQTGIDGLPVPPPKLVFDVAGTEDLDWFFTAGKLGMGAIIKILEKHDIDIHKMDMVLDFGCGIGRVLRHFRGIEGPIFHGTDYNPKLIRWAKRNLKFARFNVNQLVGPLPYKDNQFDLIYVLSVFTHLTEDQGHFWIRELTRITKPGGFLYITTHGKKHYWPQIGSADRPKFLKGELVVYTTQKAGTNECSAFHPEKYMRRVLAKDLKVVDFIEQGALGNPLQDAWLLQKVR